MPYSRNAFSADIPAIRQNEGLDFFGNYLRGYGGSQLPMQLAAQAEQERLAQEAAGLQNEMLRAKQPYLGKMAELEPQIMQAQLEQLKAQLRPVAGRDTPFSDLGKALADYASIPEEEAFARQVFEDYLRKKASNGYEGGGQLTEKERIAQVLTDPNADPALKHIYQQMLGINAQTAVNERPIGYEKPSTQNFYRKQNQEYLGKAKSAINSIQILDELENIVRSNPGMGKYFEHALVTGQENPGLIEQLMRQGVDERQLTAIQTFTKLANQLVFDAGNSMGARNFTDAKQKLIQSIKPSARNTDQANFTIIDGLRKTLRPEAEAFEDILAAVQKDVVYTPKNKMSKHDEQSGDFSQALAERKQSESSGFKVVRAPNGKLVKVPQSKVEEALAAGGTLVE